MYSGQVSELHTPTTTVRLVKVSNIATTPKLTQVQLAVSLHVKPEIVGNAP